MLAALDLAIGKLFHRTRPRKRWKEFLAFLKVLRTRGTDEKLYVICDNYSPRRNTDVRPWCAGNQIELVCPPTYGSWLKWIEAGSAALRYFALSGTDHRGHTEQDSVINAHIRWHNTRAKPQTGFATDSPIRTWTPYPAKAA